MGAPIPFKNVDNIPIVGQLCTPLACCNIAVIRCNCDAKTVVTIEGVAAVAQCPACKRCHKIVNVHYDAATNQGTVGIASFMMSDASAAQVEVPPGVKES